MLNDVWTCGKVRDGECLCVFVCESVMERGKEEVHTNHSHIAKVIEYFLGK